MGLIKIETKYGPIYEPEEVFRGEEGHPSCPFFELFTSSPDPECNVFGFKHCHLNDGTSEDCDICNADYLKCPHAWGNKL